MSVVQSCDTRPSKEYPILAKQGLSVIAFIQSHKENIVENIIERHIPPPPFPLVADQERKIYDLYGVEGSVKAMFASVPKLPEWIESSTAHHFPQGKIDGDFFLVPAEFLIMPPDFTIAKAHYGTSFYDNTPLADIYDFLTFDAPLLSNIITDY